MPSSAFNQEPRLAVVRDGLAPEDELAMLWRREDELRRLLAANFALQADAHRRYCDKLGLLVRPRLQTVKDGLTGPRGRVR